MSSLTSSALFAPVIPAEARWVQNKSFDETGWMRTHRSAKASIYFENSQLFKGGRVLGFREGVVSHDLVITR